MKERNFKDLPKWTKSAMRKLVAGLLTMEPSRRLTAAQASKLLNEVVAEVYLPNFWVFQPTKKNDEEEVKEELQFEILPQKR